jgi:hypothetical protein
MEIITEGVARDWTADQFRSLFDLYTGRALMDERDFNYSRISVCAWSRETVTHRRLSWISYWNQLGHRLEKSYGFFEFTTTNGIKLRNCVRKHVWLPWTFVIKFNITQCRVRAFSTHYKKLSVFCSEISACCNNFFNDWGSRIFFTLKNTLKLN